MKNFDLLFNEISDAIFLHDFEGNIVKVNDNACQILGYSKEEFASMNINDFAPDHIIKSWRERIEIIRNNGRYSFETTYCPKDKEFIHVEIVSKIIEVESNVLILSSCRDISERKNYELQLKEAREIAEENELELKTIFNKVPTTLILFDQDSKILRINQKGIIKFKVDEKSLINQRIGDIINCAHTITGTNKCGISDSCLSCGLANVIHNTITQNKEYNKEEITISLLKDNTVVEKTMLISTTILKKNGKKNFLATIDDITSRKQIVLDLIAAKQKAEESDKLKTAFLHNISHEIRTPMNAITGFSGFLNDPDLEPENRRLFTDIIVNSSKQLLSVITDIIEIATIEAGQAKANIKATNVNTALKLLFDQFSLKSNNANVKFYYNTPLPDVESRIMTDPTKLNQILSNLIGNAFKFTNKGFINVGYSVKNNNLEFYIEDTGIGIPTEYHRVIFERFRQVESNMSREFGGSGLGLSISKAYVELLGGELWLESKSRQGSKFYFTIPFNKEITEELPVKESKLFFQELSAPKTILIAEDEDSNYLLLEYFLRHLKFKLIRAKDGVEAVKLCKVVPAIDLVLMDLKMPVMDGYDATKEIRKLFPDLPVIAQTAYSNDGDRNKALECGCIDYISKPIAQQALLTLLNKHLNN